MKAISLWQPWASAMRNGTKQNETRSWPTSYRGPLLICSAKRKPTLHDCGDEETYRFAITEPYGCALVIVELFDCLPTDYFQVMSDKRPNFLSTTEAELGDYAKGRFAWRTRNAQPLSMPLPIIGRQGLWNITPELESEIRLYVA